LEASNAERDIFEKRSLTLQGHSAVGFGEAGGATFVLVEVRD